MNFEGLEGDPDPIYRASGMDGVWTSGCRLANSWKYAVGDNVIYAPNPEDPNSMEFCILTGETTVPKEKLVPNMWGEATSRRMLSEINGSDFRFRLTQPRADVGYLALHGPGCLKTWERGSIRAVRALIAGFWFDLQTGRTLASYFAD
jgi:hypothetical protein